MDLRRGPDDPRVGRPDDCEVLVDVVEAAQDVPHGLEPGALLVVALHDGPRRLGRVRVEEHRLLGIGVLVPLVEGPQVHRRQLPLPDGVDLSDGEAGPLLGLGHREPELDQVDAGAGEHPLQLRDLPHELPVLLRRGEAHHSLDARPVVPGAVEQDDLPGGGKVLHVALEVPLRRLALARLVEGDHRGAARVQVLHEPLDRAALPGGVAPLEQDDQPLATLLHPVLQLEQLDLQSSLLTVVLGAAHPLRVRVVLPEGLHGTAVPVKEHRVVVVAVIHDETLQQVVVLAQRVGPCRAGGGVGAHGRRPSPLVR